MKFLIFLVLFFGIARAYETNCALNYAPNTIGYLSCNGGTCSTDQIATVSIQTQSNLNCNQPQTWVSLAGYPGITLGSGASVTPFLQTSAAASLKSVVDANKAKAGNILITSALRTAVAQHILYQWSLKNKCGITVAATPGNSNHNGGLAIDTTSSKYMRPMKNAGWTQPPGDSVHLDYPISDVPLSQLGPVTIKAFQSLYNQNVPLAQRIPVTGIYDDATGVAMDSVVTSGFSNTACAVF